MTDTFFMGTWLGAGLGLIVLWCIVCAGTEYGMAALRVVAPRAIFFTVCGLMLLLLSMTLSTSFEAGHDAMMKIMVWVVTAVPIAMSMTFALVIMTLFQARHKIMMIIRGNSPDRQRVS